MPEGNILTAPYQVGVREDIADLTYLADHKETPFKTMVKKGSAPLDLALFEYGVKNRGDRKHGGVSDGEDLKAFDMQNPKRFLQCRSEVWRRAPMVGFIAQIRSLKGAIAGVKNQFNEAVADQIFELGRDLETELLSNQDSRPDDGRGLQTRGMGRWVWDGLGTFAGKLSPLDLSSPATGYYELAPPAEYRTPSDQIYTGSVSEMTEDQFAALIQAKWEHTGGVHELKGFVTSTIKNRIGFFSKHELNVDGYTTNVHVTSGRVDGSTLYGASIDIYKSDWGTFTLYPEPTDYMPTAYTGYFLDMAQVQLRVTQMQVQQEIPNMGGGPREMIQAILALQPGDLRSHAKIDGTV